MRLIDLVNRGEVSLISKTKWTQDELDACDEMGRTALMIAAIRGDYKIAQLLKQCGANLHLRDSNGRKAVDLAALYGHGVVIACLIEGGCGG